MLPVTRTSRGVPVPDQPTIFVSVASYADPDVAATLADAFARARHPERLRIGVCAQEDPADPDFLADYADHPRVRIHRMPHTEARGPMLARHICAGLIEDEDFFFQIDAHSRFFPDWDAHLVDMYAECDTERAVISGFPPAISHMGDPKKLRHIGHCGFLRELSPRRVKIGSVSIRLPERPRPAFSISAANIFGPTAFVREVPIDPHMPYGLQHAEQFTWAVRLYTHGWDLFTPNRHTVATAYAKGPRAARYNKVHPAANRWRKRSWHRAQHILGLGPLDAVHPDLQRELDVYGLGDARTVSDYFRSLGAPDLDTIREKLAEGLSWDRKAKAWLDG